MDTKELYREILNEHNINPTHKVAMDSPDFCLEGVNPSCGDQMTYSLEKQCLVCSTCGAEIDADEYNTDDITYEGVRQLEEGISERQVADKYIDAYNNVRNSLNIIPIDVTPRVTDTMDEIILVNNLSLSIFSCM